MVDYLFSLSNDDKNFLLFELIENAKRRAIEGKYDDAIARLYRALEMLGQIEFEKEFKCSTSDVNCENLPLEKRNEIREKYFDYKDNKVKLSLFVTFDLLKIVKNRIGLLFSENFEEVKKILFLRNNSILAHGMQPITRKEFEATIEKLEKLIIGQELKTFRFPILI